MRCIVALAMEVKRARELVKRLKQAVPEPRCELTHADAWQLLIATILSAQSTDVRVNQVTPELFARFASPAALAAAPLPEVEELVRSTGFFRNKAKAIVGASRVIAERHDGKVPRSMAELIELPGVARKTANVVLGTAYGIAEGIVVDTHVGRVARRLGLTKHEEPAKIERDLCELLPKSDWIGMGHRLLLHGRYVCKATKPDCGRCPLNELCPSARGSAAGTLAERTANERRAVPA